MSNYFLAIYPLNSSSGHHITVGYFQGITPAEIQTIESEWERFVRSRVVPEKLGNQYIYLSKQGTHYYFDKPLSPTGNSILVKGALEKLIQNFRNHIQSSHPSIYAKLSKRMLEPHINVGPSLVSNWRSLSISPFILIHGVVPPPTASPQIRTLSHPHMPSRTRSRTHSPARKTYMRKVSRPRSKTRGKK